MRTLCQINKTVRLHVGYAYRTDNTVMAEVFQRPVCPQVIAHTLMEQDQVRIICPQLGQGMPDALYRFIISVMGDPHFCRQENIFARDAAFCHSFADRTFIAVKLRSINKAVSAVQRIHNSFFAFGAPGYLEYAETFLRHGNTIIKRNVRDPMRKRFAQRFAGLPALLCPLRICAGSTDHVWPPGYIFTYVYCNLSKGPAQTGEARYTLSADMQKPGTARCRPGLMLPKYL